MTENKVLKIKLLGEYGEYNIQIKMPDDKLIEFFLDFAEYITEAKKV